MFNLKFKIWGSSFKKGQWRIKQGCPTVIFRALSLWNRAWDIVHNNENLRRFKALPWFALALLMFIDKLNHLKLRETGIDILSIAHMAEIFLRCIIWQLVSAYPKYKDMWQGGEGYLVDV